MRLFWGLIVVLLAGAIAALLVLPESFRLKDLIGWTPAVEVPQDANLKDDSRVPSVNGAAEPAPAATAGGEGTPELRPLLADQVPFDTACGFFLTAPGSRDVIFMMPDAGSGEGNPPAALNLEGGLVVLRRTEADGEPLGKGAFPRQVFRTEDGTLTVVTRVAMEAAPPTGRVALESGEMTVMMAGRPTLKLEVAGAAGC